MQASPSLLRSRRRRPRLAQTARRPPLGLTDASGDAAVLGRERPRRRRTRPRGALARRALPPPALAQPDRPRAGLGERRARRRQRRRPRSHHPPARRLTQAQRARPRGAARRRRPPARPARRSDARRSPAIEARRQGRLHSLARDKAAIQHHYDVSNDFYALLLGPSMVYSCAYFAEPGESLEAAQERKLELICAQAAVGARRAAAGHRLRLGLAADPRGPPPRRLAASASRSPTRRPRSPANACARRA